MDCEVQVLLTDKDFIELTKDMSPEEILNYYRNLYYNDGNTTERGIVANAINDVIVKLNRKEDSR